MQDMEDVLAIENESGVRGELLRLHLQNQKQAWESTRQKPLLPTTSVKALHLWESKVKEGIKRGTLSAKHPPSFYESKGGSDLSSLNYWWLGWLIIIILAVILILKLFWEHRRISEPEEASFQEPLFLNDHWKHLMKEGEEALDDQSFQEAIIAFEKAKGQAQNKAEKGSSLHHLGIAYWQQYLSEPQYYAESLDKAEKAFEAVPELIPENKTLILDNLSWLIALYQYRRQKAKATALTQEAIGLATQLGQTIKIQKLKKILEQLESKEETVSQKFKTLEPGRVESFT